MAIDPRIALGVQPMQLQMPDPNAGMNALAKAMQLKDMQSNQQMNALVMEEKRRSIEDGNALRSALSAPDADPYKVLLQRGRVKEATDFAKGKADVAETTAKTQKYDFDMGITRAQHVASVMSTARDQASYDLARQRIAQSFGPQYAANMPPQFDPGIVQSVVAEGQTIAQRLSDLRDQQRIAETGRHNVATEKNAAGQLSVAQGNLGLRRQELDHSRSQPRGQFIETTNGYVLADPKTGAVRPVLGADGQPLKGKAADRQMTDAQAKANLFGSRMSESHRILTELEGKYSPMAVNAKMGAAEMPLVGGVAGYAGNIMLSQEGQQAEQAQRDFINAVLRRESGAVISPAEFSNGQKQYFPQPGDNKAVLDQKRRNRELAIRGMEAEVPGGFRNMPSLTSTGQQGGGGRSASGKVIDFGDLK